MLCRKHDHLFWVLIWPLIPETRDKRLEQIEEYWQRGREWPEEAAA